MSERSPIDQLVHDVFIWAAANDIDPATVRFVEDDDPNSNMLRITGRQFGAPQDATLFDDSVLP